MSKIYKKITYFIIAFNIFLCFAFIRMTTYLHERTNADIAFIQHKEIIVPFPYDYLKKSALEGVTSSYNEIISNPKKDKSYGSFMLYSIIMCNKYGDTIAANDFKQNIAELKAIMKGLDVQDDSLDNLLFMTKH